MRCFTVHQPRPCLCGWTCCRPRLLTGPAVRLCLCNARSSIRRSTCSVDLVAGKGGAFLWPQLIGYARARPYLLTGEPISGLEAAAIGLITESVAADQLDEKVAKMAARIARGATHAIKWTKASINAGLKVTDVPPNSQGDSSHLGGSRYCLRTVTRGYRHLLSPHSTMLIQESDRVLVKFLRTLHLHPVTHLREEHETHIGTLLQEVPRPLLWAELILDAPKS